MDCKFPLSRFTMHPHTRKDKLFWARLKKVTSAFAGKRLEHLGSRDVLCVHRPKSLNALNVREYKILTEQNHCLCNNVIYRLSAATNQSANDQSEDVASPYQSTSSEPRPSGLSALYRNSVTQILLFGRSTTSITY